ncbi:MAG TPA: glycosyltransferase [Pelobium sp.]|nr:glycosyltransferase [Pelobium sp.]
MLSICIPHYNFVNPVLFETLFLQCKSAKISFEILIADDASVPLKKTYLKNFIQPEFSIFFLEKNIGRSAIRNFLASKAKYPHLLFLDADAEIINENFIANYLENLGNKIVSGGRVYQSEKPDPNYTLHYKYGSKIEQHAQVAFQSNNFIVPKSVFDLLVFDEEIKGYGYEDVLFGLEATRLGFELKKINNPVKHIQLKTNEEFVNDLEQALKNLKELITKKRNAKLEQEVTVSDFYRKIRNYKLTFLLSIRQDKILKKARALLFLNIPIGATLLIAVYKLYYFHSLHNVKDDIRSRSF